MKRILIENKIPFIAGRFDKVANVEYVAGKDITPETVKNADALLVRTRNVCNEALLKQSDVKIVATATIGTDHIDREWCEANGITVANAPGCNAPGVAQYVWTALLGKRLSGIFDTARHTLGVIGYGNVGKIVAEWGRALGVKVLVNDPPLFGDNPAEVELAAGIEAVSLDKLLAESDAVTFHVPLTKKGEYATHHLLNSDNINLLKQGAVLINASRGGVVDETALNEREDIHAVIDTWEGEPNVNSATLQRALIATPHIAGYSLQGKQRATRMVCEAVGQRLELPVDVADLPERYTNLQQMFSESDPAKLRTLLIENLHTLEDAVWPNHRDEEMRRRIAEDFDLLRESYPYRTEKK